MADYGSVVLPCPLAEAAKKAKEKTWIEIELVGEDDKPVPGMAYRITVTDGKVVEGKLDDEGKARIDGLDPGNCAVSFPELDRDAWEGV